MILICAAVPAELKPLIDDGFSCRGENFFKHRSKPLLLAALGIGGSSFLLTFSRLFSQFPFTLALLTGTCGIYPQTAVAYEPGTLFSPTSVCLADGLVAENRGYFPEIMPQEFPLESGFWPRERVFSGPCLSPAAITADDALAVRLGCHYRAVAEQMECFAFAAACREFNIKASALFAVSNMVGSAGHQQWLSNHEWVVEKSCALIRKFLPELLSFF
jgi:nucleoside phosphorylase